MKSTVSLWNVSPHPRYPSLSGDVHAVSYTHLTLPTN